MEPTESVKRKRLLGLEAYDSGSEDEKESAPTQLSAQALAQIALPSLYNEPTQIPSSLKRNGVERLYIHKQPASGEDRFAKLSDELLLRIFKSLDIADVMKCSRVNKKWRGLSSDGEVWRGLYYDKFVLKEEKEWLAEMRQEDKRRRDDRSIWGGSHGKERIPWMARYKLETNWWKGKAQLSIIHVEDRPPVLEPNTAIPSPKPSRKPLAQLHNGTLYTADAQYGLRAWQLASLDRSAGTSTSWEDYVASRKKNGDSPAQAPLEAVPTALKIDPLPETAQIAVGFEDGSWSLWDIPHRGQPHFKRICCSDEKETPKAFPGGAVVEIALRSPYVFSITSSQLLRLHKLTPTDSEIQPLAPVLLQKFTSHTSWPPYALALRSTQSAIIASIAYAIPNLSSNWSIGHQETHVDDNSGKVLDTRIGFAVRGGWFPMSSIPFHHPFIPVNPTLPPGVSGNNLTIKYNHPHLVVGSGNNGLWSFDIRDVEGKTMIKCTQLLLGHTSGIAGVEVDKKGKCVSVQRGGAIHVRWLDRLGSNQMDADVHVATDLTAEQLKELQTSCEETLGGNTWGKEWVGSDEERIVVLRRGKLFIYDFR